ncbi:BA75_03591T0 [Komagataella pastoris]|uniref:BA75_03591T0 n=1 Tax=Komagataella pastoris TaxID=4922 RepID=A0A1B2JFE7_PICPA|nr:BA75_03591T0 [Komagataella pastoris]
MSVHKFRSRVLFSQIVAFLLQLIGTAFLILSCLTVPVTNSLALSEVGDFKFGVFGYCSSSDCSEKTTQYPYVAASLDDQYKNWIMSDTARDILSKIIVVVPVAAFFTLVTALVWGLSLISGIKRSPVFWKVFCFLQIIAFMATVLVIVVSYLLFSPHTTWVMAVMCAAGGCSLVSVILVILCASWVSRARKYEDEEDENEKMNLNDDLTNMDPINTNNIGLTDFYSDRADMKNDELIHQHTVDTGDSGSRYGVISVNTQTKMNDFVNDSKKSRYVMDAVPKIPLPQDPNDQNSVSSLMNDARQPMLPEISDPYSSPTLDPIILGNTVDERDQNLNYKADSKDQSSDYMFETGSNFTSVSQKGINPQYYPGAGNYPVLPGRMDRQQEAPAQQMFPASANYYSTSPQMLNNTPQFQGPPPNQGPYNNQYQTPVTYQNQPSTTDLLLSKNPDFFIGGHQKNGRPRRKVGIPQNYVPQGNSQAPQQFGGPKNRNKNNIPAASMSRDSPYGHM